MVLAMMFTVAACGGDDAETPVTAKTLKGTKWSGSFIKTPEGSFAEARNIVILFESEDHGKYTMNNKTFEFDFAVSGTTFSMVNGYYTDLNGNYEIETPNLGKTLIMTRKSKTNSEVFQLKLSRAEQ